MKRKRRNTGRSEALRRLNETVVQVYTSEGLVGEFSFQVRADGESGMVSASTDPDVSALWFMLLWTILRDTEQTRITHDIHRAAEWKQTQNIPDEGQLELPSEEDVLRGLPPDDNTGGIPF